MKTRKFPLSRSFALLLALAAPCLAVQHASAAGGLLDAALNGSAIVTDPAHIPKGAPGTPYAGSWNPGSSTLIFGNNLNLQMSLQPKDLIFNNNVNPPASYTAVPGVFVFLSDPNGGIAPSNWEAVLEFFNPADPTGSLGLAATQAQAFLPSNSGPNGYASLGLLPQTIYLTGVTPSGGGVLITYVDFGPDNGINGGQTAVFVDGAPAVPEPGTWAILLIGLTTLPGGHKLCHRRAMTRC